MSDRIDWLLRHANYGRVTVGLVSYAAPRQAARAMGLGGEPVPGRDYLMRLFGCREIVLGGAYLLTSGDRRRFWQRVALAVDVLDTAAAVSARVSGTLRPSTAAYVSAVSGATVAVGVAALVDDLSHR